MLRFFLLFSLFLIVLPLQARKYFKFTPRAQQAYSRATSLRFGESYALLARMKLEDPDNLIVHHIENYIDIFTLYIREDEETYKLYKKKLSDRLDKIRHGDENSPYYLYVQADIRLQWALARFRFEDYLGAFTEISKAHRLLTKNEERFPDFMPNKKDLGVLHAMAGTVPDNYRWGVKLITGLEGTIAQGKKELEEVLAYARQNDFIYEEETLVLYAFLLLHLENKENEAWSVVSSGRLRPMDNPMHCFVMANIAMRSGQNGQAVRILEKRPRGAAFLPFPYLEYMLGLAKLRRLDTDAGLHFHQFLEQYKGRNFIKEAYQKMAWEELLKGNLKGYHQHMQSCLEKGYLLAGGDKSAHQEGLDGVPPDTSLLKARLLFDGGYFRQGYQLLSARSADSFRPAAAQLEYYYRLGRLLHGLKRYEEALMYYQHTINHGADAPQFFACNAALQKGLIFEQQGKTARAREAFELCLSLKPDEYRTGLHQKAKSGLNRLEKP